MQMQDLAKLYETKTHEELVQLAADAAQLTPEAHTALASELARRRIDVRKHLKVRGESDQRGIEQPSTRGRLSLKHSGGVAAFVAEVLRVYHGHFRLFVRLVAPAVVVGYVSVFVGRYEGREIARHLPRGIELLEHRTEIIEIWFMNLAGWLVSWTAFSFSFAAICSATRQIVAGVVPSRADSFADVRERTGSFLRLTLLLFFLTLVAVAAASLFTTGVLWVSQYFHARVRGWTISAVSIGSVGLSFLVLSRLALAMPAVVLDNCGVGQALFRSDELTEGKWLTLAALLAKSLVGGYVAGMCPFWLASWALTNIPLPYWFPWVLTVASIAAVTVVEPTMFIGFVLLYLKMSALPPTSSEAFATQLA